MKKKTVASLLQELMVHADSSYQQNIEQLGSAFVVGANTSGEYVCNILASVQPVRTPAELRRFATVVRKSVRLVDGSVAGIMCELPISHMGAAPVQSVMIYVDRKYGAMSVYMAPKIGDRLLFQNLGVARPGHDLFPNLIPIESYGPILAEA